MLSSILTWKLERLIPLLREISLFFPYYSRCSLLFSIIFYQLFVQANFQKLDYVVTRGQHCRKMNLPYRVPISMPLHPVCMMKTKIPTVSIPDFTGNMLFILKYTGLIYSSKLILFNTGMTVLPKYKCSFPSSSLLVIFPNAKLPQHYKCQRGVS